jgi:hypothetical protein
VATILAASFSSFLAPPDNDVDTALLGQGLVAAGSGVPAEEGEQG